MNHLRVIFHTSKVFFKTSLQQEIAFRFDFFAKLLNTFLVLTGTIGGILILFSQVNTINGWSFYETLTVTGVFMFIQSLKNLVIAPSLSAISGLGGELWTGSFDFTLLKPIPTRLYISIRNWSPLVILDICLSIAIIGISVYHLSSSITFLAVLCFILTLLIALLILYSVMLILSSVAFWYLGTPLLWIFDSFMEMGRYPVKIYPEFIKNILTWVIPVGLIVTIPVESLLGKTNIQEIVLAALFSIVIYIIAVIFFRNSLKKYSSASS